MKKSERAEAGPACRRCGTTNREQRSFCRKCGVWLKPTPLARPTTSIKRGRPPNPTSTRRRGQHDERAAVVAAVIARDRTCRASAHGLTGPCGGPLDPHEIIPRSAWPAGRLDVGNVILVCRQHHQWIDGHPHGAHALGLHGFSWERPA